SKTGSGINPIFYELAALCSAGIRHVVHDHVSQLAKGVAHDTTSRLVVNNKLTGTTRQINRWNVIRTKWEVEPKCGNTLALPLIRTMSRCQLRASPRAAAAHCRQR